MTMYHPYEFSNRSTLTAVEIQAYLRLAHAVVLQTIKDTKRDDYYAIEARAFLESPHGDALVATLLDFAETSHNPMPVLGLRTSDILAT